MNYMIALFGSGDSAVHVSAATVSEYSVDIRHRK